MLGKHTQEALNHAIGRFGIPNNDKEIDSMAKIIHKGIEKDERFEKRKQHSELLKQADEADTRLDRLFTLLVKSYPELGLWQTGSIKHNSYEIGSTQLTKVRNG